MHSDQAKLGPAHAARRGCCALVPQLLLHSGALAPTTCLQQPPCQLPCTHAGMHCIHHPLTASHSPILLSASQGLPVPTRSHQVSPTGCPTRLQGCPRGGQSRPSSSEEWSKSSPALSGRILASSCRCQFSSPDATALRQRLWAGGGPGRAAVGGRGTGRTTLAGAGKGLVGASFREPWSTAGAHPLLNPQGCS